MGTPSSFIFNRIRSFTCEMVGMGSELRRTEVYITVRGEVH
jgi:hypothetical protein